MEPSISVSVCVSVVFCILMKMLTIHKVEKAAKILTDVRH